MKRTTGATLCLLVATLIVRLAITGAYKQYVRAAMGPWLLVAGVALGLCALAALLAPTSVDDDHEDHQHHHVHGASRAGWLLVPLLISVFVVAPGSLGSFALDHATRIDVTAGGSSFAPLPSTGAPYVMPVHEFVQRAFDEDGSTLGDATVSLTGFVADGGNHEVFRLARYQIACCAADAQAAIVRIVDNVVPVVRDSWVTVEGTFGGIDHGTPVLRAVRVASVAAPPDPYE